MIGPITQNAELSTKQYSLARTTGAGSKKGKNESKSGVYSCEFVVKLKKQSQFLKGQIGANSYMKGYYEEFQALKVAKNKPNSKPNKANSVSPQTCAGG